MSLMKRRDSMNYHQYILQFINEDSGRGDIARDIAQDPQFPATNDYEELDYYLSIEQSACDSFLQVFERTFKEFQVQI